MGFLDKPFASDSSLVSTNATVPSLGDVPVWNGTQWVASSAATPPAVRPTYFKPFVLKCPECSAPTIEGQATCQYCNVPLAWEPIESLSRDDRFYREREREFEIDETDVVPLGFGPVVVCCNSTTTLQIQAQIVLRPTHLFIPPKIAEHFSVEDFRIGAISCLYSRNPIPGFGFSSGRGMPMSCDTATPGVYITLMVWNKGYQNINFEALLRCKKLPKDAMFPAQSHSRSGYPGYSPSILNYEMARNGR
jgi:hypothetical protein